MCVGGWMNGCGQGRLATSQGRFIIPVGMQVQRKEKKWNGMKRREYRMDRVMIVWTGEERGLDRGESN